MPLAPSIPPSPPWLAARDPRWRLLAVLLLALTTLNLHQRTILMTTALGALLLTLASGWGWSAIARRLQAFELTMLILALSLLLTVPGDPWLTLGPMTLTEQGLARTTTLLLKAHALMWLVMALLGTLEPVLLGRALAHLGAPEKLVHLWLFTVRYLGLLAQEYQRLRQALRARAFVARSNLHTWRTLGWLLGMLLVRSLERSRRIVAAMKCRGFDQRLYLLDACHWQTADTGWSLMVVGIASGLLLGDRWL